MRLTNKLAALKNSIHHYGSCVLAFSGGVDSTFLLKAAARVLPKKNLLAVTAISATYPPEELRFSKKICKELGVRHKVIKTAELGDRRFIANPKNRCYFCKNGLFSRLKKIAVENNLKVVIDASTVSDKNDFRPGNQAKTTWGIKSPLVEAGLTKEEIRLISKQWRLPTWNKPAQACLASRIPYGTKISSSILRRVCLAERFLAGLGFTQVRARDYGNTCRIEVDKKKIAKLAAKKEQIIRRLKGLGYTYITIDLEGYRTGSLNEVIKEKCVKK